MRKIIIDTDPGLDDVIAITLAHKADFDIRGIVTVAGNNSMDIVIDNAKMILSLLKSKVNIYRGNDYPLNSIDMPKHRHANMDMRKFLELKDDDTPISETDYLDFYKNELENGPVTIVAIGPLTNIATLIDSYPNLIGNIEELVVMGGGIERGNIRPYAEYNIFADPEAAKIVFSSDLNITLASLNLTDEAIIRKEDYKDFYRNGGLSEEIFNLLEEFGHFGKGEKDFVRMHDATTIAYLAHPEIFESKLISMDVDLTENLRGMTFVKDSGKNNIKFLENIDREKFSSYLIETILDISEDLK